MSRKSLNLRWYYAHQGLLSVLFVLRIIGAFVLVIQFINIISTANYYYVKIPVKSLLLIIAVLLIDVILIVLTRKVNKALKERDPSIITILIIYYIIQAALAFFNGLMYNIRVAILSVGFIAIIATPIIIYYSKRKDFFWGPDYIGKSPYELERQIQSEIADGWTCPKCGKTNSKMLGICECGYENDK